MNSAALRLMLTRTCPSFALPRSRILLILLAAASLGFSGPLVYVTNSNSNKVSVIDMGRRKLITEIRLGAEPFGLAFSPDGSKAYIANAKSSTLSALDSIKHRVIKNVRLSGKLPVWVAVSPDGRYVYVTNEGSHDVSIVAAASLSEIGRIRVGHGPAGIVVSPDGRHAYTANEGTHDISQIDLVRKSVIKTIPVGSVPQGIAISPDGAWLYVANFGSDSVSFISTAKGETVAEIPVQPDKNSPAEQGPTGIAISPDGQSIYTANFKSGSLSVIDTVTRQAIAAVPVGAEAFGIGADPNGTGIFVASGKEGQVSIVDRTNNTVGGKISLAQGSFKLAVRPEVGEGSAQEDVPSLPLLFALSVLLFFALRTARGTATQREVRLLLAGILLFALSLRLIGLDWGIPDYDAETARAVPSMRVSFHMDEDNFLWHLLRVRPEALDFYVADFHWGTLQYHLVEAALLASESLGVVSKPWRESFLNFHPEEYARLFIAGRVVCVLLGGCSIILAYLIGTSLFDRRAGIWSALVLALLPLHVVNSHYLTPDVSMVFFLLLAFYGLISTWKRPRLWVHLGTGGAFGLAISAKYNAVFLLPVIVFSQISQRQQPWSRKVWIYVGTAMGFCIGEPYALVHYKEFWATLRHTYLTTIGLPSGAVPSFFELLGLQLRNAAVFGIGIPLTVGLMVGAVLLFRRSSSDERLYSSPSSVPTFRLIWATLLCFFVSALCIRQPMIRYILPVVVFAALPLGYVLCVLCERGRGRIVTVVVILLTGLLTFSQLTIFVQEHTVNQAFQWIERHVPAGASLIKGWPEIPVLNGEKYRITNFYTGNRMVNLKYFFDDENGRPRYPDYVLLDNLATFEVPDEFLEKLHGNYSLVAEFKRSPGLWKFTLPEWNAPHDWKYSHPEIRIYRKQNTS